MNYKEAPVIRGKRQAILRNWSGGRDQGMRAVGVRLCYR